MGTTGDRCVGVASLGAAVVLVVLSANAKADPAQVVIRGDVKYLHAPAGRTLYTYNADPRGSGKSNCDKQCAQAWPPFIAVKGGMAQGDWTVVSRDDGQPQWAYKGRPLYMFFKDTHPGAMRGQNFEGHAWQVASP